MLRLLDSDVMVDVMRGYSPALEWLDSLGEEEAPGLPGFVVMELIEGERIKNRKDLRTLREQLRPFRLYWPNAAEYEQVLDDLFSHYLGGGLRPFDVLIGACAVSHNAMDASIVQLG